MVLFLFFWMAVADKKEEAAKGKPVIAIKKNKIKKNLVAGKKKKAEKKPMRFVKKKPAKKNLVSTVKKKKVKENVVTVERPEEEDFVPSLSDTLNDTNKLKNRIKRQLAKELLEEPGAEVVKQNLRKKAGKGLTDEIARFGDFEVGISERGEEALGIEEK